MVCLTRRIRVHKVRGGNNPTKYSMTCLTKVLWIPEIILLLGDQKSLTTTDKMLRPLNYGRTILHHTTYSEAGLLELTQSHKSPGRGQKVS
ncbi:hypothetical protein GDO81_002967 [Engystomops pustulosus]|uniref:Uncharacterized protein n=1 Tax=Engystomops pustulosus TaxID=76066 RepID=A0AAV7DTJ3_ENGPU|nr:hypothetical protein GDO81_002967 [Engystomops pustulosus]